MYHPDIDKHLKHNFIVNVMDGAFFGLAMGFASMVTIVPLFVASMTDSTILIGLVGSVHMIGWNLPQILTANWVAKLKRFLPMVMWMTFHERWPFFGLAAVALLIPTLGSTAALILTFLMLAWFALGGGFTATAWQTMIGKIMPIQRRGFFWGTQSSLVAVGMAIGGFVGGVWLEVNEYPQNFASLFFIAGVSMMVSMAFLGWTREPAIEAEDHIKERKLSLRYFVDIWNRDRNFRWFTAMRALSQVAHVAISFFTIYGVRQFDMSESTAGAMLVVMTLSQTVAAPMLGGLGDRIGHRRVYAIGAASLALSVVAAMLAPDVSWLYITFALGGVGHTVFWTTGMTMTVEFGPEAERPYYVGLVNTLIAPANLTAPFIGGWLVDAFSFDAMFLFSFAASILTVWRCCCWS